MKPLGINVLLESYHPMDSFCFYISESEFKEMASTKQVLNKTMKSGSVFFIKTCTCININYYECITVKRFLNHSDLWP